MKSIFRMALALGAGFFLQGLPLSAQSDNLRVTVANLNQDVSLMAQQLATLRLEIEAMQRENARLREQVTTALANKQTQTQLADLSTAIETLRREYQAADEMQKNLILTEVTRQTNTLAAETQKAIGVVANAVGSQPQVAAARPVHFSEDYPETGITYTVRSGDTLSKIAREQGSTIKHIQNANKIVNPARDLRVGQTIFIPIAQ